MNQIDDLSEIQKFICNLFKITPITRYDCVITIYPEIPCRLLVRDVVASDDGNKFLVTDRVEDSTGLFLKCRSATYLHEKPNITMFALIYSVLPENN